MECSFRGLGSIRQGAKEGDEGVLKVGNIMNSTFGVIWVAVIVGVRSDRERV